MAGFGETSAIVGLIATAAPLSKALIDIAGKYKEARKQIESFGHEIDIRGNVLDQMYRLLGRDHLERDIEVHSVTARPDAKAFFAPESEMGVRGGGSGIFACEIGEHEDQYAAYDDYAMFRSRQATQENARQIHLLPLQSDAWAKHLETIEEEITISADNAGNSAIYRTSIMAKDMAASVRSIRESIMSLYGHQSYY